MVYFMRAGLRGPYKIGVSDQPDVRRRQIQRDFDNVYVSLDAVIPGAVTEERRLHEHFSVGRLRGEWFLPGTPGLREFVSAAGHMETFWPDDVESPCLRELLDVVVPDLDLRRRWTEACRAIVATDTDASWHLPGASESAAWSRSFTPA